jgi:hypothetical protein
MRVVTAVLLSMMSAACSTAGSDTLALSHDAVPVEVWTGGDDGLTQRLVDAVRNRFERSAQFRLSPSGTPNALKVTIPTHVGWEEINGKTRVSYQMRLERGNRLLGDSSGVCWETDLEGCANQVVETASRATFR